jgi:hypothetical protein
MTKTFGVKDTHVSHLSRIHSPVCVSACVCACTCVCVWVNIAHTQDAPTHAFACFHIAGGVSPPGTHALKENLLTCVCVLCWRAFKQKALRCLLEYCQTDGDKELIFSTKNTRCKNC